MDEIRNSVSPANPCVISDDKNFDSSFSEESSRSSSVDASSDAALSSAAVTEEMFKIEHELDEERRAEQRKLEEKALAEAEERKENCYKRLQHLLDRSSIYAQFLVRQMEKQEALANKRQKSQASNQTRETQSKQNTGKNDTGTSSSKGKKRPARSSPKSAKRARQEEVQLSEIFNKKEVTAQAQKGNKSSGCDNETPVEVLDTYSRTINGERISDRQPNLFTGGVMRDYQIEALEWLKVLYENGVNGILGDEMGLGKTIEVIALIAHLVEMGVCGPFLVVCPLSTVCNWVKEFKRFTPEIPVILYHGPPEDRAVLRKKIYRKALVRNTPMYPVVVTSYSMVMRDVHKLKHHRWFITVDEGHRLKNWECHLIRDLKMYQSTNRLLLTGTPLQNNLAELWSLLNFLLPEIFDDLQVFESWFDVSAMTQKSSKDEIVAQEQEKQIVSTIHQILAPFLLRRTKADVNLNLPPKKELIVYAPLTAEQRDLYNAVVDKTISDRFRKKKDEVIDEKRQTGKFDFSIYFKESKDDEAYLESLMDHKNNLKLTQKQSASLNCYRCPDSSSVVKVTSNAYLVMYRKICNHPYLVEFPLDPVTDDYLINEDMVRVAGKMQILDIMLPELRKRGHKVLIFSQFVIMLNILEFYCEMRGYPFHRIDGKVDIEDRQKFIDDFNENPSSFLFLISTKAGGLGINLTSADTVILYDSDWNPQNDLQAQDRCHRYGQTKPVVVYRLVTANTAESKIVDIACAKRKLEKMIIKKGRFCSSDRVKAKKMVTSEELSEILSETDYSETLNMEDMFSAENLDALLDRSDLLQSPENSSLSNGRSTKPTEVKGLFKVVEQLDSCDFTRNGANSL